MNKFNCLLVFLSFFAVLQVSAKAVNDSPINGLTMVTPAEQWREALPSGNGTVGALVYGSIFKERVLFNHNELWYGGNIDEIPDMSAEFEVVKQLMRDGKYLEANGHYKKVLTEKGFKGKNARYHPAFDMLLTNETQFLFEDYSRSLDFESGEVKVQWRDGKINYTRRLFVSIPDNVSAMSITADHSNAINGDVTLDIHDLKDAIAQNGQLFDPGFTYRTTIEDDFVVFRADGTDGGEFGGVLRVIVKEGESSPLHRVGKEKGDFVTFTDADEVVLIVGFFANEKSIVAVPRLKKELATLESDYDVLLARHKKIHSARFNTVSVTLNGNEKSNTPNEYLLLDAYQNPASAEMMQKLFNYGRYLLISSSRVGGYPANLQGIWNGDYQPPWASLYGLNENLQMNYWQALSGNLDESMMAFFDYFDSKMDDFRYNATQLWGCRGIYVPPFMSPESGIMRHTAPHVVNWTDAAGWLASFYYDYYLFTGDEDFLRDRAIPFMKEVALFYEDFMEKDSDGTNMFYPSQSPENEPADKVIVDPVTGREHHIKVQINATITVAISKQVMSNLVEACSLLGIEKEGVDRWGKLLEAMPEYQINEDGALREWMHPDFKDNYEHRHQSHIYPLFPGTEITEESLPELYEACKVAIEKRLTIGLKSQTGWSLAHMANVYARLGEGEKAKEALDILTRCCLGENFFTYHNDWRGMGATMPFFWGQSAPFQMDANFGISAAVCEMLCGSTADIVRILPAVPVGWESGAFNNMHTRAGVEVSVRWNDRQRHLEITLLANRDTEFHLKFPGIPRELNSDKLELLQISDYGGDYRLIHLENGEMLNVNFNALE